MDQLGGDFRNWEGRLYDYYQKMKVLPKIQNTLEVTIQYSL